MIKKLLSLVRPYNELILYMAFGALTTVVTFAVYLPLFHWLSLSATVSNSIAWFAAVIVAFVTNKIWVFKSKSWSRSVVVPEFLKFLSFRVVSGVLETVILLITVDILSMNGTVMKVLTSIFVVVANYLGSKVMIFRKKK